MDDIIKRVLTCFLCLRHSTWPPGLCHVNCKPSIQYIFRFCCVCLRVFHSRPYSYPRYLTGTSLQLWVMWGFFSNANVVNLFLMISTHTSLHCKLVNPIPELQIWLIPSQSESTDSRMRFMSHNCLDLGFVQSI